MACASGADATTRHAVSGQLACLRAANGCQLWVRTAITFVATFKGPIGPRTHSMAKDLYELVINATSSLKDDIQIILGCNLNPDHAIGNEYGSHDLSRELLELLYAKGQFDEESSSI